MELGKKAVERKTVKKKLMDLFEKDRKEWFSPEYGFWPCALLMLLLEYHLVDDWVQLGDKAVETAKGFPISPGFEQPRRYYDLAAKCYDAGKAPEKAKEARLAIAKHWEDEAGAFKSLDGCGGSVLAHRFGQAIQAYRDVGEKDKADALIPELTKANQMARSQLKHISTKINVEPLYRLADERLRGKTGLDAIEAFESLHKPLSYVESEISAKNKIKNYPLQAIFDKSVLTPEGNVSQRIPGALSDSERRTEAGIIDRYVLNQNLVGATALGRGIAIILDSDGTWKTAIGELVNTGRFAVKGREEIYERAIIAGFEGDLLLFAHLVIPQIENSVRQLFRVNGLKTTMALQSDVQRERDLNALLGDEGAEKILGRDLLWDMRCLLIEQAGPNLRNRICHGLADIEEIKDTAQQT